MNISVNYISHGRILNNQQDSFVEAYHSFALSKAMLDKKYIIGSLIFLLSDMSKYINGQNLIVDDGFTL